MASFITSTALLVSLFGGEYANVPWHGEESQEISDPSTTLPTGLKGCIVCDPSLHSAILGCL
eukprot:scaffold245511_cov40-Cyclotella_meneghiniana.AAC.1